MSSANVTAPKQVGLQATIADIAAGGAVALPAGTVIDQYRVLVISQTTAGQAITLPSPDDTSILYGIDVMNSGTASFTMFGVTITAQGKARFGWDGDSWSADTAPTQVNVVAESLTPTAQNTIPDLATPPAPGTVTRFYVNGERIDSGITVDASGVITVAPATLGYNIATSDKISVDYLV